jgi:glycosyltransferase involved in cell wall biosynthesis
MPTATVCLIAKNEERAIVEWLAYQRIIGFDQIRVYDNGSTDSTAQLVRDVGSRETGVTYVSWPDRPGQRPQPTAYADAIANCDTDWIAFFDTDEFLVLHKHLTVAEFLKSMPPNASGVAINWLVFGSGGRSAAGSGLVIDRFTWAADRRHGKNRISKSIVRPQSVKTMLVHTATLVNGIYVNSVGEQVDIENNAKTPAVCHVGAQLNHYLLKSREEFLLKKSRGHSARAPEEKEKFTHIDEEFWAAHDLNDIEELSISKWRHQLAEKLEAWGLPV